MDNFKKLPVTKMGESNKVKSGVFSISAVLL